MDRSMLVAQKRPLTTKAVKKYLKRHPGLTYLADDLLSAATLGLLDGINKCLSSGREIDDAALTKRIQGAIADTVQELSDALPVPRSTKRVAANNGVTIATEFVDRLPADILDDRGPNMLVTITECCRDDHERTILRMFAANYTQKEIASYLKINFRRVSETLHEIKRRFHADEDGSDEPYERVPKGCNGRCPGISRRQPCGKPVARWANAEYCEDCQADIYFRFDGRSRRVNV